MRVDGFPGELTPLHGPVVAIADGGRLTISAGPRTDLFAAPGGSPPVLGAPALVAEVAGDFLLAATLHVGLEATFDAGALLLWRDDVNWAKLALERSPGGRATIVSVVTRGLSDDCNSIGLDDRSARLRVARLGGACAFHVHAAGRWELIRHFALDGSRALSAGFLAQSPTGDGCTATFEEVRFENRRLDDLRNGT
jgi:uncharacterized protein